MTAKYFQSYKHAFQGLGRIIRYERNIKIHLLVAAIVLPFLIFYFKFSVIELAIVLTFMGLVIVAEIINTLIERILDRLHPENHESIAIIKDGGAGAVLGAAILSTITGLILIIPHVTRTFDWFVFGFLAIIIILILYLGLSFWRK
jgi:diacylglycerol kinase